MNSSLQKQIIQSADQESDKLTLENYEQLKNKFLADVNQKLVEKFLHD